MASMNVRSGDLVEIIVGSADVKGKRGKVVIANPKNNTVTVENLNMVAKHRKPRSAQDKGGKIEMPRAIDVSNVMLVCPKCGKATRVAHALNTEGGKQKYVRNCKKCGATIDTVKKAKVAKTTKATKAKAKKEVAADE